MTKGPILFDVDDDSASVTPASAPPVPELTSPVEGAQGAAMQAVAQVATRQSSGLVRWFWRFVGGAITFVISLAAWNYVTALLLSNPVLGTIAAVLIGGVVAIALVFALRELSGFRRLARIDRIQASARTALSAADLTGARKVIRDLGALYAGRSDLRWGRDRLRDRADEVFDADALLGLAEVELMTPLDAAARAEVEAAARKVATVTALVPLALVDVVTALVTNLRMIRRVAEIYGGRSGTLGSWRLTRAVFAHLVATGAVAIGDDMLEPIVGAGLVGKLSRRFGEGLVNGALTARVGVAAISVCRPLPYQRLEPPSVRAVVKRALAGVVTG